MESVDLETESLFKYQVYFAYETLLVIFKLTESVPHILNLLALIVGFIQSYSLKINKLFPVFGWCISSDVPSLSISPI